MKKLIVSACALAASVAAFATTVASSNTFGVLKIDTGNTTGQPAEFFIGVPWVKVGGGAIKPNEMVLTKGLKKDDELRAYQSAGSGSFAEWVLSANDGEWTRVETVPAAEDNIAVNHGNGVLVKTAQRYLYLSGQYENADVSTAVTINPSSDGETIAYTLISGKLAQDYNLAVSSSNVTWSRTPATGDQIFMSAPGNSNLIYKYNDGWKKLGTDNDGFTAWVDAGDMTLSKGFAAWYARKGTDPLTITFSAE